MNHFTAATQARRCHLERRNVKAAFERSRYKDGLGKERAALARAASAIKVRAKTLADAEKRRIRIERLAQEAAKAC